MIGAPEGVEPMNELRAAILSGEGVKSYSPVTAKEPCRRDTPVGGSLTAIRINRQERRATHQRREDRFRDVVEDAILVFRRKKLPVKVLNISSSGTMVETDLIPRIGEKIGVEFEGFERIEGIVRWIRDGRIGLDLGDEAIHLG
jgi:hypothetical protein